MFTSTIIAPLLFIIQPAFAVNNRQFGLIPNSPKQKYADLAIIFDPPSSISQEEMAKLRSSTLDLLKIFTISSTAVRVAVIVPKKFDDSELALMHPRSPSDNWEDYIKLSLNQGQCLQRVEDALLAATESGVNNAAGNYFCSTPFLVIQEHIFTPEAGDRPDAPNVILMISDLHCKMSILFNDLDYFSGLSNYGIVTVTLFVCPCKLKTRYCGLAHDQGCENVRRKAAQLSTQPSRGVHGEVYSFWIFNNNINDRIGYISEALMHLAFGECEQTGEVGQCSWSADMKSCARETITITSLKPDKLCRELIFGANKPDDTFAPEDKVCATGEPANLACLKVDEGYKLFPNVTQRSWNDKVDGMFATSPEQDFESCSRSRTSQGVCEAEIVTTTSSGYSEESNFGPKEEEGEKTPWDPEGSNLEHNSQHFEKDDQKEKFKWWMYLVIVLHGVVLVVLLILTVCLYCKNRP